MNGKKSISVEVVNELATKKVDATVSLKRLCFDGFRFIKKFLSE